MLDWLSELDKASEDLREASFQIQSAFQKAMIKSGKGVDPVAILSRISVMESMIISLQNECNTLTKKRQSVASHTTSLLLQNYEEIQQLSILVRGHNDAKIHKDTKTLVRQIRQQNEFWNRQQEQINGYDTKIDRLKIIEPRNKKDKIDDKAITQPLLTVNHDCHGSLQIKISDLDFFEIPESVRGQCKLDTVKYVAMFAYIEATNRVDQGLKGKDLCIDRQSIAKHTGGIPGLYSIIMNTSLWREIASTLQYLNFLRIEKDGTVYILGVGTI